LIPLNTVSFEVGIKTNKLNLAWYQEIRSYVPVTKNLLETAENIEYLSEYGSSK
jgi:hypothetical protein